MPESGKLYYRDPQNNWTPVENIDNYNTKKGVGNLVRFKPVTTDALKLEVQLPKDNSAGIYEWNVK